MQQSYESLDRPGGFSRVRLLAPLSHRDYRLLAGGMSISLLGDGVFLIALTWQVYNLSDAPAALATAGIAMTIPTITCLIIGGAVSDRYDRRTVMLVADLVRAAMLAALAVLSITGAARMWELLVIVAITGAATAFFNPASDALLPQLLPQQLLAQANSLDQLIRPLALRLAGPALGGMLVAVVGPGWSFALDGGSYAVSAGALLLIAPRAVAAVAERTVVVDDIKAGFGYVFRSPWIWATLVSAAVAYLLFMGPTEVLLPYIVKHLFTDGAADLGLIFAAGGLGSLACAIVIGQIGTPGRGLTFMYAVWTIGTLTVAVYGLSNQLWGLMLASLAFNTLETAGTIAWATAKQRHIPAGLLGRVSSLDWLISIGLLPVSYALTAPVSAVIGVRMTLVGAGVLGALVTFAPILSGRVRHGALITLAPVPTLRLRRVDQPDSPARSVSAARGDGIGELLFDPRIDQGLVVVQRALHEAAEVVD